MTDTEAFAQGRVAGVRQAVEWLRALGGDPPAHRPRCPVHNLPDCSPLLNGCTRLTGPRVTHDRRVLVDVLVYHYRDGIKGCGCGWSELGRSWPEHVATVYEYALEAQSSDDPREGIPTTRRLSP